MDPTPASRETLTSMFVGSQLNQIPAPAAVLDRAIIQRNCAQMLRCCDALSVMFRPHIKTHKTVEVTKLQVGDTNHVRIVVSTVAEAEYMMPYLRNCRQEGKTINVLYGIPLPPSQTLRLAILGKELGPESISVMIDNIDQLLSLEAFKEIAGFRAHVFVKVDIGYARAGLPPGSNDLKALLQAIAQIALPNGSVHLSGFYSHAGHSYAVSSEAAAMEHLSDEIDGLIEAAAIATEIAECSPRSTSIRSQYVLSVGATPSATSIQSLIIDTGTNGDIEAERNRLKKCIERAKANCSVELHAGVYPILDMQQLATEASPSASTLKPTNARQVISHSDLALTILTEVTSAYKHRDPEEALIAAGTLALGREPCKSYNGWGVVSDWNLSSLVPSKRSGWVVARISQEHGVLQNTSSIHAPALSVGKKVRIWPNHACIAGAGFNFYFVVDSADIGNEDTIVDIWMRCRGNSEVADFGKTQRQQYPQLAVLNEVKPYYHSLPPAT
ncbi:hypothetical protein MMC13_002790 [Lambiella insularis]|nr:hypothetical protein [Lambiella insularis]